MSDDDVATQPPAAKKQKQPPIKWFFYTVNKFDGNWKDWMEHYRAAYGPDYMVGQLEKGEETEHLHIQMVAYWSGGKQMSVVVKHMAGYGQVKPCGHFEASIAYVQKEETRVEGPYEMGEKPPLKKIDQRQDFIDKCAAGVSSEDLLDHPYYPTHVQWCDRKIRLRAQKLSRPKAKYDMSSFNKPPLDFNTFNILLGERGMGKTQYALAHFKNPFVCRKTDAMRFYDPFVHDGIVLDDMPTTGWTHEDWIGHTDPLFRHFACRYYDAIIPPTTPMIMCCNFLPTIVEGDEAIKRRVTIHLVNDPLWKDDDDDDGDYELTRH